MIAIEIQDRTVAAVTMPEPPSRPPDSSILRLELRARMRLTIPAG
jgi:hypothetical protein